MIVNCAPLKHFISCSWKKWHTLCHTVRAIRRRSVFSSQIHRRGFQSQPAHTDNIQLVNSRPAETRLTTHLKWTTETMTESREAHFLHFDLLFWKYSHAFLIAKEGVLQSVWPVVWRAARSSCMQMLEFSRHMMGSVSFSKWSCQ